MHSLSIVSPLPAKNGTTKPHRTALNPQSRLVRELLPALLGAQSTISKAFQFRRFNEARPRHISCFFRVKVLGVLLSIFTRSITSFDCLFLAGVRPMLRAPIPPLTFVVIDATWNIEPDNDVVGAMRLSAILSRKERRQCLCSKHGLSGWRWRRHGVGWQQRGEGKKRHSKHEASKHANSFQAPTVRLGPYTTVSRCRQGHSLGTRPGSRAGFRDRGLGATMELDNFGTG